MLDVLRHQLESGYANRSAVALQEAALAQTRATLPPLRRALAQQRDLLAAFAGIFPNQGPVESFRLVDLHLPTDLPVSLPSELIQQRPDIRAAEEQLHVASADPDVLLNDKAGRQFERNGSSLLFSLRYRFLQLSLRAMHGADGYAGFG
jgi:outer membrane protein TolC